MFSGVCRGWVGEGYRVALIKWLVKVENISLHPDVIIHGKVVMVCILYRFPVLQCSVTCGDGNRRRSVSCSGGLSKCNPKNKPEAVSHCNLGACPEWRTRQWSKVGTFFYSSVSSLDSQLINPLHPNINREICFFRLVTIVGQRKNS